MRTTWSVRAAAIGIRSPGLVVLDRPADADRPAVLVEIADLGRLQLADARPTLVDDQQRPDVVLRHRLGDPLDVFDERRRDVRLALLRPLDPLVARGLSPV